MEYRLHNRVSIALPVRVMIGEYVVGFSRALEVSSGGIRMVNFGMDLKKGKMLNIDFLKPGSTNQIKYSVSAEVVHYFAGTIGLRFTKQQGIYILADQLIQENNSVKQALRSRYN